MAVLATLTTRGTGTVLDDVGIDVSDAAGSRRGTARSVSGQGRPHFVWYRAAGTVRVSTSVAARTPTARPLGVEYRDVVWRSDLDPADVGEVCRRVAKPVVSTLLHPDELDRCRIDVVLRAWSRPGVRRRGSGFELYVACRLRVGADSGEFFLGRLDFARTDTDEVVDKLADDLQDWLAESSLAWGELREPHPGVPVGPARWPEGALDRVMLEVYPDEEHDGLLWRQGEAVSPEDLGLSLGLVQTLTRWRARWVAAMDRPGPLPVVDLERTRRQIVGQLQAELLGIYEVAMPISLDPRGWPDVVASGRDRREPLLRLI